MESVSKQNLNFLRKVLTTYSKESIHADCLPDWLVQNINLIEPNIREYQNKESIKDAEKIHIQSILRKYNGDRQKVSEVLGIDKSTL